MKTIKMFIHWIVSLFRKKKKVVAVIPRVIIPPLEPKKIAPPRVAKEFIRPDDPDYRYGSSHLIDLRTKLGRQTPFTRNQRGKV
jgi:hypothetical protein